MGEWEEIINISLDLLEITKNKSKIDYLIIAFVLIYKLMLLNNNYKSLIY